MGIDRLGPRYRDLPLKTNGGGPRLWGGGSYAVLDRLTGTPAWVLTSGASAATLDIDFVNDLAYNSPGLTTIASLLTCSRASTGYYTKADGTLTSFTSNQLRYGTNGLLVEEARTNLAIRSQTFENAAWTLSGTDTITADQAVAPDGTSTADLFKPSTSSAVHGITLTSAISITASGAHAIYIKPSGYTKIGIKESNATGAYAGFDVTGSGTVLASGAGASGAAITALANGWYRIGVVVASASSSQKLSLRVMDPAYTTGDINLSTFAGDGTSGVFIWQADIQEGSFITSPIPTTSASATRAADVVSFSNVTWLVSGAQTIYAQAKSPAASAAANICYFSDGSTNNLKQLLLSSANKSQVLTSGGGSADGSATVASAVTANTLFKAACAIAANDLSVVQNNGTAATDATATIPTGLTTAYLGSNGSSQFFNGLIPRFATFSSRISDGGLGTLTT